MQGEEEGEDGRAGGDGEARQGRPHQGAALQVTSTPLRFSNRLQIVHICVNFICILPRFLDSDPDKKLAMQIS